ncbi:class II aldolase/adducin family protein, partial [Campylobacter jejuni]|nr:class II aldolase/adducin family protein [Campylobacter jejuni]EHP4578914.1 class II aldolase/adducin family protein [Campylobacter jejuni]EJY1852932.1 class II aldolase/adducin family protein [Campylobacter jejuni]
YYNICKVFGNILDTPSKGGNISIKNDKYMIIKASGQDLKQEHKICILENENNIGTYFSNKIGNITKPSMEIGMHRIIQNKYVVHYHPVYILPYLCDKNFKFTYKCIDFILPGEQLCKELSKKYYYEQKGMVMLRNHGVIIFSEILEDLFILHQTLKNEFFEKNNNIFTPDDAIDVESFELWLFREAMENIARKKQLNLSEISAIQITNLINMPEEKYRYGYMQDKEK